MRGLTEKETNSLAQLWSDRAMRSTDQAEFEAYNTAAHELIEVARYDFPPPPLDFETLGDDIALWEEYHERFDDDA